MVLTDSWVFLEAKDVIFSSVVGDSRISSLVALVAINLVLTIVLLALYVFSVYNINSFVKSTGDDAKQGEDKPAENAAEDNENLINKSAP